MVKVFYLAPAFYIAEYTHDGRVYQPAMWAAGGDYVCRATKKQLVEHHFVVPIRVLAQNNGAWDPTQIDSELRNRWHIADRGLISAPKLRGMTVWVPDKTKRALEKDSRINIRNDSNHPKECRLFIAAVETQVFTKPKPARVDPRMDNWVTQGTEYAGTAGNYGQLETPPPRIDTLKEGWHPSSNRGGLKL